MPSLSPDEQSAARFYINLVSPLPIVYYYDSLSRDYDSFTHGRLTEMLSKLYPLYLQIGSVDLIISSRVVTTQNIRYTNQVGGTTEYGNKTQENETVLDQPSIRYNFTRNVELLALTLGVRIY